MVDADLGGGHTSGKNGNSVMAAVTFLNESHCYSYSKSIKAVCLATYRSEYYALTEGSQMAIWIARVLRDLEFKVSFPCPVVGDNQSALATASVPETKQSRHINLREHWIRNVLHLGDLITGFIPGKLNAANVGTKILARVQFILEGGWYLRGIHSMVYQDQIAPLLKDLWLWTHQWYHETADKRKALAEKEEAAKRPKQKGDDEA